MKLIIYELRMIHFIYHFMVDSFLTGTLEPTNDQLPISNVSGFIAQLVRASHRYPARSGVQTLLKSLTFQVSLRNCKNCVHNCEDHSFT